MSRRGSSPAWHDVARKLGVVPDYFLVPDWLFHSAVAYRLSQPEIITFVAMCSLCDRDRLVTSSMREIAETAGLGRTSVVAAVPALVERGFLVDLGAPAARRPRHYRISQAKPLPPSQQFGPATVRAKMTGTGWLEAL